MKIETLKSIIDALTYSVSKDQTRYNLTHCRISPSHIEATDGHIMSKVKHYDDYLKDLQFAFINFDMLPQLKLIYKQFKKFGNIPSTITDKSITLNNILVTTNNINYPNIDQLWPKQEKTFDIGIDAQLLLNLVNALGDKTTCRIKIKLNIDENGYQTLDNKSAFIVENFKQQQGLIMPVRV